MRDQIDYKLSVEKDNLKIKTDYLRLFVDFIANISLIGLPIFGVWIYVSRLLRTNTYYHHWTEIIISGLFCIGWFTYLVIWLTNVNKFYKVRGIDKKVNRQIVAETLIEKKWHILHNNRDFIITFPEAGYFKTDQQVNILFSDNEILINVITFSWRNLKSPFFPFKNKKTRQKLIKILEDKINKNTA